MTPLYIDNHLLALDKPGGLLTQPSGMLEDSLEAQGKAYIKERFAKPGNVFLEAIHRIDRPACGIVLFARTSKGLVRMNEYMRQNRCRKTYRAILLGHLTEMRGKLEDWIAHDDFHASVVSPNTSGARLCHLEYRVLAELPGGRTLVEIDLQTGRYHQIRVQFGHRGFPIVGDVRYGAPVGFANGAIALQHYTLTTPHPTQPGEVEIQSKLNLIKQFS